MNRTAIVFFVVSLAALTAGCSRGKPAASPPAVSTGVRVAVVGETESGTRTAPGVVAARETAQITPRTPATVVRLLVREGESVRRGQRLAELDDRDAAASLAAARASFAAASAEEERVGRLLEKQAATPREKDIADAQAEAARAALEQARAALAYLRPEAPFAGRVTSLPVHAGDHVMPGERIAVLESDAGFEVQATVEAGSAARLSSIGKCAVRIDGIPEAIPARVRSLSPAGDPETHRFLLRADLPADPRLKSGLFAALELPEPAAFPRLTVPASALVDRGGLTGVFVVENEPPRAFLRWIAAGRREEGRVEVRDGLRKGERVVLSPDGLVDGAAVTVENR